MIEISSSSNGVHPYFASLYLKRAGLCSFVEISAGVRATEVAHLTTLA